MAINITTTDKNEVRIPVSGAVTAGDLLINAEGIATKLSTLLSMAQLNNNTSGLSVLYPWTPLPNNFGDGSSFSKRFCENPNGDILKVISGNGTTSSTGLQLLTINVLGVTVSPSVTVSSATSVTAPRIKRLTSTTVLIAWNEGSLLRFAIYNNNGTVAVATATVVTLAASGSPYWNVSVLAAGDIVFAYQKSGGNCAFSRYNPSGVLQGTEVTVEASAGSIGICVLSQTSGDFVIYFYSAAVTAAYKFARYNSAGVLQRALTTASTGSVTGFNSGEYENLAIELSNGNLVFQWVNASTLNLAVYNSTGTFINSAPTISVTAGIVPALERASSGGFVSIATFAGNQSSFRTFTASGGVLINGIFNISGTVLANEGGLVVVPINQGFAILSQYADNTPQYGLFLAIVSNAGVSIGSVINLTGIESTRQSDISFFKHSSGTLVLESRVNNVTPGFATYSPSRSSILGVALESVAYGATCRVGTKGTYTINQPLAVGGIFDQRTATVQGTKGSVIGATAILYGLA